MSKLKEAFEGGRFAIVMEVKPPKGTDLEGMLAPLKSANGKVTAFAVPDNEHAKMRLAGWAAAQKVKEAGGEPLLVMTCRDRNRLALQSDLLGAAVLGLENFLLLSGDFISLGDHPDAKPVYDADSVQLVQLARGLMAGQDSAGQSLKGAPQFCLGAVVIPEAEPLAPQLLKVRKKMAAGVDYFVTAPVYDLQKLAQFRQHLADQNIKLLACVKVPKPGEVAEAAQGRLRKVYSLPGALVQELSDPDPEACLQKGAALAGRLVKEIRDQKLADGVYLKARGRADLMKVILDKAGV